MRYREQKKKVADMVRESMREYERKKTDEIIETRVGKCGTILIN